MALAACGDNALPLPSLLDPTLSEQDLRRALGVPPEAKRVLILSQSSHLDINWKSTFDEYYSARVETVFDDATTLLDADPRTFYSVAEMGFLAKHVADHGAEPWLAHFGTGHARIVGGGMTSPDTLLPTAEALTRDYLLGTIFAEQSFNARPRAAWLPDSFGHSPTVPDLLSAAGFTSVGFGRIDGARHTFEIVGAGLDPIAPDVTTTASVLRDLGSADFVWRGPGGGSVLAHYMPIREYCQGDSIDLDGFPVGGDRLGEEHDDDPVFVRSQIAEFIDQLTPYAKTPYLFVPIGCDFQVPRPRLADYAQWWNDEQYAATGVWVALATFEDYERLVGFHTDELPAMERDIAPVWTGFYASRPQLKQAARAVAESLAGVEPFLALVEPGSDALAPAWQAVVLSNHHDTITGTSSDAVVDSEEAPLLASAKTTAEDAWNRALSALSAQIDTQTADTAQVVVVVNPGPVDRSEVVEVAAPASGAFHALVEGMPQPTQVTADGRIAFLATAVPAFGWRTFSLQAGASASTALTATASVGADSAVISTGVLDARFAHHADGWSLDSLQVGGQERLAGPSMEWVIYADTGGLYRIGSERPDCANTQFAEVSTVRATTLTLIEAGPARTTLRATATVDGIATTIDFIAAAGDDRLTLRATGAAARGRTIMLRVMPQAPTTDLAMGVAGGVAVRPLSNLYTPSLWPAVTWVSSGEVAVELAQSTAVHGSATGALEWVLFRNATSEQPCDDLGPMGTSDGVLTETFALGARDVTGQGATEVAASMAISRPLRPIATDRHAGGQPALGRLVTVDATQALVTAVKPASRGQGIVLHLQRFGSDRASVSIRHGILPWTTLSRPDLLERDDAPFGSAITDGVHVDLDAALTALRLAP
ncbi:MAG: hypothetical protein ABI591_28950 [Kofleriaceae bacterium]